jgi:hypothetical protein
MIRVLPCGGFQNRNPLAYAPFRAGLANAVTLVDEASEADLLVISHPLDLELFGSDLALALARHRHLRLVLLSEEPFWDTGWGTDPFRRNPIFDTRHGPIGYRVISHQTSAVFRAEHLPYFLLTDPRYIAHYRPLFDRNAGTSVAQWLAHFRTAEWDAAFMGAHRLMPRDRVRLAEGDVWRLSWYRTRFAERCRKGRVLRAGLGWDEAPPRQSLPDWHADKLARLDRRCRYVGAFENTHQSDYVSEKLFDAFALGAVPLYFAAPDHAVLRLAGQGGWLNFYATPPCAPAFDARRPVSLSEAEAYARAQERLARNIFDLAAARTDLERICAALVAELRAALAGSDRA